MLILKRKCGESIELIDRDSGEIIEIMVTEAGGQLGRSAKIGIDASDRWHIRRAELSVDAHAEER